MIVFTDLGRMVSVFFLCFFLVGYVNASSLMFMFAFFCLTLLLVSSLLAWLGGRHVQCRRELPGSTLYSGDPLHARVQLIESAARWRMLELLDEHTNTITGVTTHRRMTVMTEGGRSGSASVAGSRQAVTKHEGKSRQLAVSDVMRFAQRGHYRLGPLTIHSYDPFGLTYVRRTFPSKEELLVFPHPLPIPNLVLGGRSGRQEAEVRLAGNVGENGDFHGIRPYVQGDDLRRVHWKSTAHSGKLAVKEFEYHTSGAVQVILDLQQGMHVGQGDFSTLEASVTIAASVLNYVESAGNEIGLLTTGEQVCTLPPESGQRQLHRALEALAFAKDDGQTPLAKALASGEGARSRRCVTVVVTPTIDRSIIGPLLHLRGRSSQVLLVLLDPRSFHDAAQEEVKANQNLWSIATKPIDLKRGLKSLTAPRQSVPAAEEHRAVLRAASAAGIEVYPIGAKVPLHQALQGLRQRL